MSSTGVRGTGFLDEEIRRAEGRRWRRAAGVIAVLALIVIAILAASWFFTYTKERSVAVIYVEGTLSTGDFQSSDATGSQMVGREIRGAADDPLVEAIVLRVDSPGGSPVAAQEITADMEYAKARKPIVVSMGDIATSAAYGVSAHASRIYANPDTLTGGIGTVWIFTDVSTWLEHEGYNVTVVKSGERKDMGSPYRPLTAGEMDYAQTLVNASFERFLNDVVKERNVSRAAIEDGRVIRGEEAVGLGLVDRLGNLNDAIDAARSLAVNASVISSESDLPS
ncbi:MAG TPA: signal peptide peptidase SppA [Methanomicrobiales archaeon]|jgi:protease-4|nr:signal peptide peptidase SppA [Methanomicrobiales archaeon]